MTTFFNKIGLSTFIVIFCILSFSSCLKDECDETRTYTLFNPVYKTLDEMRVDISFKENEPLINPGKIYVYQNYLFINELKKGVHVYDNTEPSNPEKLGFIEILGNIDISIKDGFMYADNYMDLLTININNPTSPIQVFRHEDVFGSYFPIGNNGFIVEYTETTVTRILNCNDQNFEFDTFSEEDIVFSAQDAGGRSTVGQGGSLARFTIAADHLYAIDESNLYIFNVKEADQPRNLSEIYIEWGVETLFPLDDKLFIGARNGMHIYDLEVPEKPQYLSVFRHATACDPVFVEGNTAYVTLRDGRTCESFGNQLDVIDISDLSRPNLIKTFEMDNPHGLSISRDALFICEGDFGLKVFDKSDIEEIGNNLKHHLENINSKDVIVLSDELLLMIGDDGLTQYNINDPFTPERISFIPRENN